MTRPIPTQGQIDLLGFISRNQPSTYAEIAEGIGGSRQNAAHRVGILMRHEWVMRWTRTDGIDIWTVTDEGKKWIRRLA